MERNWKTLLKKQGLGAVAAFGIAGGLLAPQAKAQVSGSFGVDWYSHFISYGYDVWGGGSSWGEDTLNPYLELNWQFENLNVFAGTWWDVNDNQASALGGDLQEVDVWFGASYDIQKFTVGATVQEWMYGGQTESVIDLSVSFDDSGLYGDFDIALNPTFVAHHTTGAPTAPQVSPNEGWAYVLSIEPGFTAIESDTLTVDLSFPVAVGYGDNDFYREDGIGFFSAGVAASTPLTFIDSAYGDWALNAGLTYYNTPESKTGNDDENFIVGNVGVSVAF